MSKEYEKLLKMVNELNNVTGEKCLICHFPDSNKNLIKLDCNHYFHSKCLEYSKSTSIIKCPYCDKKTKLVKNIEQEICQVILKRGINKGKECGRSNCKYHKNNLQILIETNLQKISKKIAVKGNKSQNLGCQSIIKTGPKKGQYCNRVNCHYHKQKNIIV